MIKKVTAPTGAFRVICMFAVGSFLGIIGLIQIGNAQQMSSGQRRQNPVEKEVHVLPVQGKVYMLVGSGGNITMQVGDAGVLLVNSGVTSMSDQVLAAIRSVAGDKPVHFIINTSDDADLVGGNEAIAKVGKTIAGFNVVGNIGASAGNQAGVIAFQTVLDRMSAPTGKQADYPEGAWPTDTYTLPQKKVWFNEEGIRVSHEPAAHTDGDSIVSFDRSDVVSTGDIFDATSYPVIDIKRGGSLQGEIAALNGLVDQVIPADFTNGGSEDEFGTMVIPGHGHLCDFPDLVFYQEMVIIVRDRIQAMIKKGMTLEQVKAAKPTMDYDPVYGSDTGPWTTDMFVEAAYQSLSQKH
jgi:cyclase